MLINFNGPLLAHGTSGNLFVHFGNVESFKLLATGWIQSYDFLFCSQGPFSAFIPFFGGANKFLWLF